MDLRDTSLVRLMAAAAALAPCAAVADVATETRVDYRYQRYDESPIARDRVAAGERDRYEVDAHQVEIVEPVASSTELRVSATQESMSGSSPWFVLPGADGTDPVQVMSGATIEDTRRELVATLRTEPATDEAWIGISSYSDEDDYTSRALGVQREQPFGPRGVLQLGASYSADRITPIDAAAQNRIPSADRNVASLAASIGWILDSKTWLQSGLSVARDQGYLDDPYKLVFVGDTLTRDARPDRRWQLGFTTRYRRAFDQPEGALHAEYRYAGDSWSIRAHTFDLAYYKKLGAHWLAHAGLRYHSQDQARFYAPVHVLQPGTDDYSSDARLGTFGAWSARLGLRRALGRHALVLGVEQYESRDGWALGGADAPVLATVDWLRVYAGFELGF